MSDTVFFIVIGIVFVAYGVYNLHEKLTNPKRFDKAVQTTARFMGENVSLVWQNISRIWFPIFVGIISVALVCFF